MVVFRWRFFHPMTRIEFRTNIADKISYTCRWVRKALAQGPDISIVILAEDSRQLTALDQALWTFSDIDFLPHAVLGAPLASRSRVVLTDDGEADLPESQILVNLSRTVPASYARFDRLLELVSTDAVDVDAGRKRYVHYRDRGYALHHENVNQK